MEVDNFIDELMGPLFEVLNETGHAGHCILSASVLDRVFSEVGVSSEPAGIDYAVMNPTATRHVKSGGGLDSMPEGGYVAKTGTGESGMYDHHVVTLVPSGGTATLIDPSIIRVEQSVPGVQMQMIIMDDLSYPPPAEKTLEVNDCFVIYNFESEVADFRENDQWGNELAEEKATEVINRLGV
jgi:hypothetical protein